MAHPRCGRHSRSTGKPCVQPAGPGGSPCRFHGGAAKQVRAAGKAREAEQQAAAVLARLDVDPVADPLTELSKFAGQVMAWKDTFAERVNALTALRWEDAKGAEQLHAEVAVFERAMDRCTQVLVAMAKLDIDSRLAEISKQQADAVVRAIDAGLAAAGVSGPAATEARHAAARALRVA